MATAYGSITVSKLTDIEDIYFEYSLAVSDANVTNNYPFSQVGELGWTVNGESRKTPPAWQNGYKIWVREVKIKTDIATKIYGNPYPDTAINQTNTDLIALQSKIKKIWSNSTGSYMASGIGNNEIDTEVDSTYGFNSKTTTGGISFNYNAIPLTEFGVNGLKLYIPTIANNIVINSNLGIELTTSALKFYDPTYHKAVMILTDSDLTFNKPNTTTAAAVLNNNGLILSSGGIEAGNKNTTDYIYLYSNDDATNHTLTINGHEASDWRIVAGNKFGVDKAGNLYASNADISGKITSTEGKIGPWFINNESISRNANGNAAGSYNADSNIYFGTSGLSLGTAFKVDSSGNLNATNAEISGVIKATGGYIGNGATNKITIGDNTTNASIYSNSHDSLASTANGFYLGTNGLSIGSNFKVTNTGSITAANGTIGGFILSSTQLNAYGTASGAGTSETGLYRLLLQSNPGTNGGNIAVGIATRASTDVTWSNAIWTTYINHSGYFKASNALIEGVIRATSGYIGNNATNKITIGDNSTHASIYSGSHSSLNSTNSGFYIGTDGLSIGSKFKYVGGTTETLVVDNITATNLTINSGSIASGVTIGGKAQSYYLNSNIQIGGRNLLKESDLSVNMNIGGTERYYTENGWWKFSGTLSITGASRHSLYAGFETFGVHKIAGSGEYTLTNWVENLTFSSSTMYIRTYIYSESTGTNTRSFNCTSANSSITFTVPEGEYVAGVCLYFNTASSGISLENAKIRLKLEEGNVATDWTPAPEDKENTGGRNYAKTNLKIGSTVTPYGVTGVVSDYGTITLNGTSTERHVILGTTSFGGLTLETGTYKIWFTNTSGKSIWPRIGKGTSSTYLFSKEGEYTKNSPFILNVIEKDVYYVGFAIENGATFNNFTTSIMWERCTVTDFSLAPEDEQARIDSIQVGGRNLLRTSWMVPSYSGKGITITQRATAKQWIDVSGTATELIDQWVANLQSLNTTNTTVTISASSVFSDAANCYFYVSTSKNNAWYKDYKQITWYSSTERRLTITLEDGETLRFIRLHVPSGTVLSGGYRFKVELGNKQTDWSPAPEDVEIDITYAGQKATNYITAIDSNGIKIHASNNPTLHYAKIDATGMEIYKSGYRKAQFGSSIYLWGANNASADASTYPQTAITTSGVTIAQSATNKATISSNGLDIYSGSSIPTANFSSSITLGSTGTYQTAVNPDSFIMSHDDLGNLYSIELGDDETRSLITFTTVSANKTVTNIGVPFTETLKIDYQIGNNAWATADTYTEANWAVGASKIISNITFTRTKEKRFTVTNSNSSVVRINFTTSLTAPGLHMHWYGANNQLWEGAQYMTDLETIRLREPISAQPSGIVLVWSAYDNGAAQNHSWQTQYIPKGLLHNPYATTTNGINCNFILNYSNYFGKKILNIFDTSITGHAQNDDTITSTTPDLYNAHFVLRFVYGV